MKTLRILILLLTSIAILAMGPLSLAADAPKKEAAKEEATADESQWQNMKLDSKRQKIDAVAGEALQNLLKASPNAKSLYKSSYGYAVFDNLKFAFFLSGGGGKGVAEVIKTKQKTYMAMGSAGAGLGFGGQKCQIVFLFQDEKTFKNFVEDGWTAGGTASATAGEAGAGAGTAFVNGIAYYQLGEKGLMANADISGSKYWKDADLN